MSKFPSAILLLPSDIQTMAMQLAVLGLTAQERFTLKAAIDFFVRGSSPTDFIAWLLTRDTEYGTQVSVLNTSRHAPTIADSFLPLITRTGYDYIQATIAGASLYSPRSTIPNFAELLVASVVRIPNETREWVVQVLSQVSFVTFQCFVALANMWWDCQQPTFPGGKETPQAKKRFQDMLLK
jgi:hypothetical protein